MDFTKSRAVDINPSPEYVYYDATLSNIDSENHEAQTILSFEENRDTPLINDVTQYKMSIVRFELSTWQLPVFYFQAKTNSANPLEGIYSVTLEYDKAGAIVTGAPVRVLFDQQDKTKSTPLAPNTFAYGLPGHNEFYYVYNFNNFITMVNTALDTAFTALQGAVGLALATARAPYLVWNDDLTATLYAELTYYDITKPEHVRIYFNRPLYSLFNSFPSYKNSPDSTGKHYQILTHPRAGLNCTTIVEYGPQVLIATKQEFPTNESWTAIDSLVWCTNMPIVPSAQSNPTIYQNGQQILLSNTYNYSQNIISDFQTSEFNYRSTVYYVPSAEYRYVSFQNNQIPLKNMILTCYIKDRYGVLRPFYMPSNSKASVKILFKRLL